MLDRVVAGAEVLSARWDAAADCWRLATTRGDWTAGALVLACGRLAEPRIPPIDLGDFRGPIFHSARWRHDVPLAGRRVAVVGTGASAVQLVPELRRRRAPRSPSSSAPPPWVMPRQDRAYDAEELV